MNLFVFFRFAVISLLLLILLVMGCFLFQKNLTDYNTATIVTYSKAHIATHICLAVQRPLLVIINLIFYVYPAAKVISMRNNIHQITNIRLISRSCISLRVKRTEGNRTLDRKVSNLKGRIPDSTVGEVCQTACLIYSART